MMDKHERAIRRILKGYDPKSRGYAARDNIVQALHELIPRKPGPLGARMESIEKRMAALEFVIRGRNGFLQISPLVEQVRDGFDLVNARIDDLGAKKKRRRERIKA